MNREESRALRDAIDTVLTWPPAVRIQIAAWLAPEASKPGTGRDPDPPPIAPALRPAKVRQSAPFNMKAAEQRLLEALAELPGSTVAALAKACVAGRSRTGERLRQLAARGVVTKDSGGHWRLLADLAGEAPDPTLAPSN